MKNSAARVGETSGRQITKRMQKAKGSAYDVGAHLKT
jgi:hypothetical protein